MPKPGDKNAPTFDTEKPEELGRFFDRVEDWFLDEEIEDDKEKKRRIVKYLDADSEVQWKALSKFSTGTYEEFKSQVMSSYPAAEEVMKGSVTALKRKIKKLGPVQTDDRDELLSLIRIMTAEIMKLKKIDPPIHTNRELVDLFLGRLDPEFASRVANKLAVHRLIAANMPVDPSAVRNPEDMYDIEEVMEMAKQTSLEHANPFGKFLAVSAVQTAPTTAKLEEAVARLTDTIQVQLQHSKAVDQKLHTLQSFVNQPRPMYNEQRAPVRPSGMGQSNYSNMNCFYCEGPHRIVDCVHVTAHIDQGLIKKMDGRLRLADGSQLPRKEGKSAKELVEALKGNRPGVIPMAKLGDKAPSSQRVSGATYVQTQYANQEDELLQELIYKLGTEKTRQYLQAREEFNAEAEEWEQNFY
jgi:hypothetical protein